MGALLLVATLLLSGCGSDVSAPVSPEATELERARAEQLERFRSRLQAEGATWEGELVAVEAAIASGKLQGVAWPTKEDTVKAATVLGAEWAAGPRVLAAAGEVDRYIGLTGAIKDAGVVAADKAQCGDANAVTAAWMGIANTPTTDPQRKAAEGAAGKLERCRKTLAASTVKAAQDLANGGREAIAHKLERTLLDSGLDTQVTVRGTNKDQLRIKGWGMTRVAAHQMAEGGAMGPGSFLWNLQEAGFSKVTWVSGAGDSTFYTLEPKPLPDPLAGTVLGQPFTLPK